MLKHIQSLFISQKGKIIKNPTDTGKKADFMLLQKMERYFTDHHAGLQKRSKIRSSSRRKERQKGQDLDPVDFADLDVKLPVIKYLKFNIFRGIK